MRRSFIKPFIIAVMLCMAATFTVAAKPVISSEKTDVAEAATTPASTPAATPATPQRPVEAQPVIAAKAAPKVRGNVLFIPSIGLAAQVVTVGTTAANAIDVPAGMQVGYWNGSSLPGTLGAAFLDGHKDGIFGGLSKLAVGQTLSLTYEGQTFNYRVVYSEVVLLATIDMQRSLSVYGDATEGLNLMTCAGTYVSSQGTYDRRLVVYAVRV